jgi:hypothetical protein
MQVILHQAGATAYRATILLSNRVVPIIGAISISCSLVENKTQPNRWGEGEKGNTEKCKQRQKICNGRRRNQVEERVLGLGTGKKVGQLQVAKKKPRPRGPIFAKSFSNSLALLGDFRWSSSTLRLETGDLRPKVPVICFASTASQNRSTPCQELTNVTLSLPKPPKPGRN